jgi:hypothetical protein
METSKGTHSLPMDIKNIEIKVTSNKGRFKVHSLDEDIVDSIKTNKPSRKYSTSFVIVLTATKGNWSEDIVILRAVSFEPEASFFFHGNLKFAELCSMIPCGTRSLSKFITDDEGFVDSKFCPINSRIMYINELNIENKYRKCGIGEYLLNNVNKIIYQLFNYEHHVCLISKLMQAKSGKFYKDIGFKPIKGSEFMYRIPP